LHLRCPPFRARAPAESYLCEYHPIACWILEADRPCRRCPLLPVTEYPITPPWGSTRRVRKSLVPQRVEQWTQTVWRFATRVPSLGIERRWRASWGWADNSWKGIFPCPVRSHRQCLPQAGDTVKRRRLAGHRRHWIFLGSSSNRPTTPTIYPSAEQSVNSADQLSRQPPQTFCAESHRRGRGSLARSGFVRCSRLEPAARWWSRQTETPGTRRPRNRTYLSRS